MNTLRGIAVALLTVAGGCLLGVWGLMIAGFAGDAGVSPLGNLLLFIACGLGGAFLGATPGLLLGRFQQLHWATPRRIGFTLGAAVGAITGLLLMELRVLRGLAEWLRTTAALHPHDTQGLLVIGMILGGAVIGVRLARRNP